MNMKKRFGKRGKYNVNFKYQYQRYLKNEILDTILILDNIVNNPVTIWFTRGSFVV